MSDTWRDNEVISLENVYNDRMHYVSTSGSASTAQAGLRNERGPHERFLVHKISGSPGRDIQHGDVITLRNSRRRYLTAMPPSYYDSKILSYSTWEGPWQKFKVHFVSQYDRSRPAW